MGTLAGSSARSNARAKSRWEVKRRGPRLAYRSRIRWTTGSWLLSGWRLGMGNPQPADRGERQQLAARRADLDLGVLAGADAAVEARRPAAVVLLVAGQGVLPVLPEPVLVEPRVEG